MERRQEEEEEEGGKCSAGTSGGTESASVGWLSQNRSAGEASVTDLCKRKALRDWCEAAM
jgi:hypothetical protein